MLEQPYYGVPSGQNANFSDALYKYHVGDVISHPWIASVLVGSVFIIVGTAIRLTRMSGASTTESGHIEQINEQTAEQTDADSLCKKCCTRGMLLGHWEKLCRNLPTRIWNFYIEAFLVPSYRKEWGKYKAWSYRSPCRKPKSHLLKDHIQRHKHTPETEAPKEKKDNVPQPIPHCHADCARIRINVSGILYETQVRTLERFPDTLLGNAEKRLQYYNPKKEEYYFDRSRRTFEVILYYYQSGGRFRRPENIPADILVEDAHFFHLSPAVIEQFRSEEGLSPQSVRNDLIPKNLLKRKIWVLFNNPESSRQSGFIAFISILALFLSIGMFCVETIHTFDLKATYGVMGDGTVKVIDFSTADILDPFFFTETACNAWFILEYLAKFLSCPVLGKFFMNWLNLIDLIAILPYALSIAIPLMGSSDNKDDSPVDDEKKNALNSLYLLRIVRIIRVFRIFKLSRHSKGLKILGRTLSASLNELILLAFFIILGVVFFSSTMYFAELDDETTSFDSIPAGFWWAVITLTTIGYGDFVPKTALGKVVGSLCAIAGVLTIALPVPVIVSNFNYFYHQAVDEQDLKWISINHVASCPFRPTGFSAPEKPKKRGKHEKSDSDKRSSEEEFGNLMKNKQN